jgi:hypothetical protein
MRVVLGVPGLVEEGVPVVRAADRLDHEHDAARDLDRRAERARRLRRARLDVEVDVLLRAEIDPEAVQRAFEGRQHRPGREPGVPLGGAKEPRHVPAAGILERNPDPPPEQAVERGDEQVLRLGE